jgi:hypothetical protein
MTGPAIKGFDGTTAKAGRQSQAKKPAGVRSAGFFMSGC